MKRIMIIMIILTVIVCIIGIWALYIFDSESIADNDRFKQIGERQYFHGYWFYVCYDKETKVQYTFSGKGGIAVLSDSEGQPLLYEE